MKIERWLALLLVLTLCGCGYKDRLYLPEEKPVKQQSRSKMMGPHADTKPAEAQPADTP